MTKQTKNFIIKKKWIGKGITVQVSSQGFQYDHDCAVEAMMPRLLTTAEHSWKKYGLYTKSKGWPKDVDACIHQISESLSIGEEPTFEEEQNNITAGQNQSEQESKHFGSKAMIWIAIVVAAGFGIYILCFDGGGNESKGAVIERSIEHGEEVEREEEFAQLDEDLDEKELILRRIQQPIPNGLNIATGSVAIPFFGDYQKATSCTISLNPSDNEFHRKKNGQLLEFRNRIVSRNTLGLKDDEHLSIEQSNQVYESCLNYFHNDPYRRWFDRYDAFLREFDLTYYNGSVVHLDIVQWATSPTWSGLTNQVRGELVRSDLPFLRSLLDNKNYELIFLNGRTTVQNVTEILEIEIDQEIQVEFNNRKSSLFFATYNGSKVIGWSPYLQSPAFPGYERISEFAELIKAHWENNQ